MRFRRPVHQRDHVSRVGGDHTAGDTGEDVVHVVLHLGDGVALALDVGKEAGVFHRNGGLRGRAVM
jgi:hypothetical protein